jgi:hypothetical protein
MAKSASRVQRKNKPFHRARKAPACIECGRRTKRDTKRHPSASAKRRSTWSTNHKPCQFHKKYEE